MGRSRTPGRTAHPGWPAARGWATSGGRSRGGSDCRPVPYPRRSRARSGHRQGGRQGGHRPILRPGPAAECQQQDRQHGADEQRGMYGARAGGTARGGAPTNRADWTASPPDNSSDAQSSRGSRRGQVEESDERQQSHDDAQGDRPAAQAGDQGEGRPRQQQEDAHARRDDPAEMVAEAIEVVAGQAFLEDHQAEVEKARGQARSRSPPGGSSPARCAPSASLRSSSRAIGWSDSPAAIPG